MNTCLRAKKPKRDDAEDEVVALVHSHHLLDHKPDNLLLKGGKHKLRGVACLGRPGVALCIGPSRSLQKFRAALESAMPQKRFKTKILDGVSVDVYAGIQGFARAEGLGDFRTVLASIGREDEFFELTGISPEADVATQRAKSQSKDRPSKKRRQR